MRYKAKIDWWIGASLAAAVVIPALGSFTDRGGPGLWIGLAALLFILGLGFPQWYETAPDGLVIRSGLVTRRIPYQQITAVRATADGRRWQGFSVALSQDRIEVEYGGRSITIAPQDQEAFYADVASRAPQLSKRGQNLEVSFV